MPREELRSELSEYGNCLSCIFYLFDALRLFDLSFHSVVGTSFPMLP